MKKKINYKKNYIKKELILFIVFFLFSFFIVSGLILSNRNYFVFEKVIKEFSSKLNLCFQDKLYSNNYLNENLIDARIRFLQEENKQLKNVNQLKQNYANYEVAQVINHLSGPLFNKIELSKGSDNVIKKGNPVINSEGLIGFVSRTSKNVSEVNLITGVDKNNMLSVFVNTNEGNISGLLNSYNRDTELFKIINVSSKSNVKIGDKVYLSGYNNELYKGIYFGEVNKIEESNYGLKKNIYVKSNVNFDDILFVLIIKE